MRVAGPGFGVLLPPCCVRRVLLCLWITGPFNITNKAFHIRCFHLEVAEDPRFSPEALLPKLTSR